MAVTQVVTRPEDDGQAQGGDFGTVSTSYRQSFRAECDSGQDRSANVLRYFQQNSGTLPWMGKTYKIGNGLDAFAECNLVTARFVEGSANPWLFDVEATFKTPQSDSSETNPSPDGESDDPLDWLDEIEVSYTQTSVAVEIGTFHGFASTLKAAIENKKMENGKTLAITNSALIPYSPPIEKEKDIRVIRITRSVPSYDGTFFRVFQGAVNKDTFTIAKPFYGYSEAFDPLTAKIKYIGGVFSTQKQIRYWRQTIEIHVDPDGWRRKILDQGMMARREQGDPDGEGDEASASRPAGKANYHQNTDTSGSPLSEPVLFDGNGQPQRITYPPVYGTWGIYKELNFMPLAGRAW